MPVFQGILRREALEVLGETAKPGNQALAV